MTDIEGHDTTSCYRTGNTFTGVKTFHKSSPCYKDRPSIKESREIYKKIKGSTDQW